MLTYLADARHPRHGELAVEVVLHGLLAEEQVHLVVVAVRAVHALGDVIHVHKGGLWDRRITVDQ